MAFTFVTPTFGGDVERFRFLRESMLEVGAVQPHIVLVDDEDLGVFRRRVPTESLTVLSSRDVLSASIEDLRRRGRSRLRRRMALGRRPISGWMAQQLMKLAAVDLVDTAVAVPLDSDAFFLRAIPEDFYDHGDGRWFLHEFVDAPGPEVRAYTRASAKVLQLTIEPDAHLSYVSVAPPLAVAVVRELRARLDDHYGDWASALVGHGATEYTTYGLFARHVHALAKVEPIDRRVVAAFYGFDPATFESIISAAHADPTMYLGMVHSRLGVPDEHFQPVVRRLWRREVADDAVRWAPPGGLDHGRV